LNNPVDPVKINVIAHVQADEICLASESVFFRVIHEFISSNYPSFAPLHFGQVANRKVEFRQLENKNSEFFADDGCIGF
jgi:hypothetical protein